MKNDLIIAVPSYKRAGKVETIKSIPSSNIFIHKSEYEAYKKFYKKENLVVMPDGLKGNVAKVRNFILDYGEDATVTCMIDDDLLYLAYWENGESHPLALEKEVYDFIYKYSVIAMDLGVHLWGINVAPDQRFYPVDMPFKFIAYISASFSCHIEPKLRYDERFPLKEDYDFVLQNLNIYRRVLRVNKYYYVMKHQTQTGGCATYRNVEREREQLFLLQKKWGKKIVRADTLKSSRGRSEKVRKFDINPLIYPPIKGT